MASAKNRTRKLLKIERCCEHSRLQGQLIAAAYELITPVIRRVLPSAISRPAQTPIHGEAQPQLRTGGNQA
jgi:hypothetical protein